MSRKLDRKQLDQLATTILDVAFEIHRKLGPGLLESVYVRILMYELHKRGLSAETEVPVTVTWDAHDMGLGFRADIVVEGVIVLEVKSANGDNAVFAKQLMTYLKLLDLPLGYVINFNKPLLKDGIQRVANGLPD